MVNVKIIFLEATSAKYMEISYMDKTYVLKEINCKSDSLTFSVQWFPLFKFIQH